MQVSIPIEIACRHLYTLKSIAYQFTMDLGIVRFHVEMENLGVWPPILLPALDAVAQSKSTAPVQVEATQVRKSAAKDGLGLGAILRLRWLPPRPFPPLPEPRHPVLSTGARSASFEDDVEEMAGAGSPPAAWLCSTGGEKGRPSRKDGGRRR
jgi:hypothetical protein